MTTGEKSASTRAKFAAGCVSAIACLLLSTLAAFGQGELGSITGSITDPQGSATPNASIDVRNVDTGRASRSGRPMAFLRSFSEIAAR
jgi:hypothetical protein